MSNTQTRPWFHFGARARATTSPIPRPSSARLQRTTTRLGTVTVFSGPTTSVPPQPPSHTSEVQTRAQPPPTTAWAQPPSTTARAQPPPTVSPSQPHSLSHKVVQVIPTSVAVKPMQVVEPNLNPSLETLNFKPKTSPLTNQSLPRTLKNPNAEPEDRKSDVNESYARAISLAGENKGAVMEITGYDKKASLNVNGRHGLTLNAVEEEEGGGKRNNMINPKETDNRMRSFTNSNVQGINNSIVYHSSSTHHDPGVHFRF